MDRGRLGTIALLVFALLGGPIVAAPSALADPPGSGSVAVSLTGLPYSPTGSVVSVDGGWRLFEERPASGLAAAVWRSSDGVNWQRVAVPAATSEITRKYAIGEDGTVYVLRGYHTPGLYWVSLSRFISGAWVNSVIPGTGSGGGTIYAQSISVEGSVVVAFVGPLVRSTNGGTSFTTLGAVPSGTTAGWLVGGQILLSRNTSLAATTTTTVSPWNLAAGSAGTSTTLPFAAQGFAVSPLDSSTIWAVATMAGRFGYAASTDHGVSWSQPEWSAPIPWREGAAFGPTTVDDNGTFWTFGAAPQGAGSRFYSSSWSAASALRPTFSRLDTTTAGAVVVGWPGVGLPVETISQVSMSSGGSYSVGSLVGDFIGDAPVLVTRVSTDDTLLRDLAAVPLAPVSSPNGSWTLVAEGSSGATTVVWRSPDRVNWERIPLPRTVGSDSLRISDGGAVQIIARVTSGASQPHYFFRFETDWSWPAWIWNGSPALLTQSGSSLFAASGTINALWRSDDDGWNWRSVASYKPGSTTPRAGILHLVAGSEYWRWSTVTQEFLPTSQLDVNGNTSYLYTGLPSGTRVLSSPTEPNTLWLASATSSTFTLTRSPDNGATLEQGTAWGFPVGVSPSSYQVATDGNVYFYGVAQCTSASLVYSISHPLGSGTFSAVTPIYLDESKTAVVPPASSMYAPPVGREAWFSVTNPDGGKELRRVEGASASPESVFGFDGYGLTARGVNLSIGGLVQAETDASIAGVGPKLELVRTYNSQDRRVGIFGRGWTSTFETRVYENCLTKDVTVLHGDGRREYFPFDGVSGYLTSPGYTSRLAKTGTTGWTLTGTDGYASTFRSDGRVTSVADADGQKLLLTWNASNQLTTVSDQVSGRSLTFSYVAGRVSSVSTTAVSGPGYTGPSTWNYVYSGSDLARVCEPRNNNPVTGWCTDYTVTNGRISQLTDRNGHVDRKVGYDAGRLAWTEDGLGNRTSYAYPTRSRTIVTDANGNATISDFDSLRRLVKVTDPAGGVTQHEYDTTGFRSRTTDPLGHATTRTFDINGNVVSETDGAGSTTYFAYDAYNNRTDVRDARSASANDNTYRTTTTWDGAARNKLSEVTPATAQQPSGTTRTWSYTTGAELAIGGGVTPKGLLKTETDARGATTTYGYDSAGNLRDTLDRSGLHTTYTYDSLGRQLTQTEYTIGFPAGVTTVREIDRLGNVVTETAPATTNAVTGVVHQLRVTSTFDPVGNLTQITESDVGGSQVPDNPRTRSFAYDAGDRPTSVVDAEGGVTVTEYDPNGNVTVTVDPRGTRQETSYDSRNLPVSTVARSAVLDEGSSIPRDVTLSHVTYDAAGRQVTVTNANGVTTALGHDAVGRLTSRTMLGFHNLDSTTRDVVLETTTYDAAGHATSVTTGNGVRTEQTTYDAAGQAIAVVLDPGGLNRTTTVMYDANGNITNRTVSDGTRTESTTATYNSAGQALTRTVENGATDLVTSYTYDNRGVLLSTVDPRGNAPGGNPAAYRTDLELDQLGRTIRTLSPPVEVTEGGTTVSGVRPTWTTGLDTYGQATHQRDERGNTTTQTFDRLGRLTSVTHPAAVVVGGATVAPTELSTYDAVGNLVSSTDRRGHISSYTFDRLNRVITRTDPPVGSSAAGTTTWFYDDLGNPTTVVDQRGARTEASFDDAGRQRTHTAVVRNGSAPPQRFTTTFDYDDLGNTTLEQNPAGDTTRWEFSAASEPITAIAPDLAEYSATYDVAGRQITSTDPQGRRTSTEYDLAGRAVAERHFSSTGALLTTATAAYDGAGNLIASTSPRGVASSTPQQFTTTYSYDPISRLSSVAQPTSANHSITTAYRYDAAGNLTSLVDGRGNTTQYTYNAWELQTSVIEPATGAHPALADRTWTSDYDSGGLPVRSTEPGGITIERTFDALGRLTQEAGTGAYAAAARSFGYDLAGNRTAVGSPTGDIGFVYDDRGLLTATTGPTAFQSSFAYDPAGRMVGRTDAAGTTSYSWTSRSELATVTDTVSGTSRSNSFDASGHLVDIAYSGGAARHLAYDDLGRLLSDDLRDNTNALTAGNTYGYDLDDHVTSRTVTLPGNPAAGVSQFSYDNAGRLSGWTRPDASVAVYAYDDAGNLVNNAGQSATYDARNRLITAGATSYAWTPRGTLQSTNDTSGVTTYGYDSLDRLVSNGTTAFAYDSLDRIATAGSTAFGYAGVEIDPVAVGGTRIARSPGGLPIAAQSGTDPAVLIGRDRHGDIGYAHTASGAVSATSVYDPFGSTVAHTGTTMPLGFQGDYTDPASGDVWMGARWYRPGTGGFTSRDSVFGDLQTPVSVNRHTYANADPIGMWDPDGRAADYAGVDCAALGERIQVDCYAEQGGPMSGGLARLERDANAVATALPAVKAGLGFVPILGDAIDAWDCTHGDALSCAAAIPFIGTAANAAKFAKALDNTVDAFRAGDTIHDLTRSSNAVHDLTNASDSVHDIAHASDSPRAARTSSAARIADTTHTTTHFNPPTRATETEVVQRWMSEAELKSTKESELVRGGREGTHYVTDSANSNPLRARQRLSLPQTPEVRVDLEVPRGTFSSPTRVEPDYNMPGGGMQRTASGDVPCRVVCVWRPK